MHRRLNSLKPWTPRTPLKVCPMLCASSQEYEAMARLSTHPLTHRPGRLTVEEYRTRCALCTADQLIRLVHSRDYRNFLIRKGWAYAASRGQNRVATTKAILGIAAALIAGLIVLVRASGEVSLHSQEGRFEMVFNTRWPTKAAGTANELKPIRGDEPSAHCPNNVLNAILPRQCWDASSDSAPSPTVKEIIQTRAPGQETVRSWKMKNAWGMRLTTVFVGFMCLVLLHGTFWKQHDHKNSLPTRDNSSQTEPNALVEDEPVMSPDFVSELLRSKVAKGRQKNNRAWNTSSRSLDLDALQKLSGAKVQPATCEACVQTDTQDSSKDVPVMNPSFVAEFLLTRFMQGQNRQR
ncbi:unnamed protein product [Ostreobium quekettii]|uniref:Uncharacterized protein n=1 Tax=Ostreobium quekettii TaxID=121088 RepID=A0A8S1JGK1_9CHLO|nr:unnamed protein product [Ostreobium quekettii]